MTTPTPHIDGGVPQGGRRQQAAHQGQREDAVEESGMVIGEAAADGLGHQRIDAGVARADEEDTHAGAERVVGEEEEEAAEHGASTLPSSRRPWRTRGRMATATRRPVMQEQPVERQDDERTGGTQAHAAVQEQRQPAGDGPFVAELNEQQQGEEHRAGAAEILQRLAERGMRALGRRGERLAGVDAGEECRAPGP